MATKKFTNAAIIGIMRVMNDEEIKTIKDKKLPVKLLYALRRSLPNITEAYKPYEETLNGICDKYGCTTEDCTPEKIAANPELSREITELLNEETEVTVHTVPESVIEQCGEGAYDALSLAELDRLWWLIEEEKEDEE